MECMAEKNLAACTCTYDCERRGRCCECVAYHRSHAEIPGCSFSREAERTYDRSISRFIKDKK